MEKEKYRIIYDTQDIQKIADVYNMDELLYMLMNIKIKKWSIVKIINLYK
jgi:hypothetical protein|tara:strand:- start:3030 stop:3179 length:150 start_codon:yes stop_codon:yes gene_type:complete